MKKSEELLQASIQSGRDYTITYVIDEKGLNDAIGIELVTILPMQMAKNMFILLNPSRSLKEGTLYTFQTTHSLSNAGSFKMAYRMYPKTRICLIVRTSVMFVGFNKERDDKKVANFSDLF